jgi:hypothetical protein
MLWSLSAKYVNRLMPTAREKKDHIASDGLIFL